MPSLRQLLETHPSLLFLDTASSRIQVGWLSHAQEDRWEASDHEAGRGLFECIEKLSINPTEAAAIVFCQGPGSILGIRTAAMAIRSWLILKPRPVYHYRSLNIVSHAINEPETRIIADARRDRWHCQELGKPLQQIDAKDLTGDILIPEHFRYWSTLPAGVKTTSYNLSELNLRVHDAPLFEATEDPDAYLHTEPSYKQWTPQIHRTP